LNVLAVCGDLFLSDYVTSQVTIGWN